MNQKINNLIPIAIVIVGVVLAGAYIYVSKTGGESQGFLSAQEAAEKAIDYINQVLEDDVTASLIGVTEESGLYKFRLKIEENEYESFVTKDGRFLFSSFTFDLEAQPQEQPPQQQQQQPQQQQQQEEEEEEEPFDDKLESLAKCLTEKGAKFYGAYWCGWCNKEKELFGQAAQYLPYVECSDKETQQMTAECQTAGVSSFPTWEFGGEKSSGYKTLEQLAELSGCEL